MKRLGLTVFLVGLVLPLVPRAQTSRPNFSGTWTMDQARSESPHYPDFVGPVTLVNHTNRDRGDHRDETRREGATR